MGRLVGEIAVVGARTRARAALAMAAGTASMASLPEKKIKKVSATTTRCNIHGLRRRRRATTAPMDSASSSSCRPGTSEVDCSTTVEICSDFLASCCSSNNASSSSSEFFKDPLEIAADPEQQQVESAETSTIRFNSCGAQRREKMPSVAEFDERDSPPRRPDAKSTVQIKAPSDSEIEEFFASAENDLQKRFADKYNFNIAKDVPLEGRYEWIPIKP